MWNLTTAHTALVQQWVLAASSLGQVWAGDLAMKKLCSPLPIRKSFRALITLAFLLAAVWHFLPRAAVSVIQPWVYIKALWGCHYVQDLEFRLWLNQIWCSLSVFPDAQQLPFPASAFSLSRGLCLMGLGSGFLLISCAFVFLLSVRHIPVF